MSFTNSIKFILIKTFQIKQLLTTVLEVQGIYFYSK